MKKILTIFLFVFLFVSCQKDKEPRPSPYLLYPSSSQNFVRFPVPGTPTTYIITSGGKKLVIIYGAATEGNFRKFLFQALKKAKKSK